MFKVNFQWFLDSKKNTELFDVRLYLSFFFILPCIAGKGQRLKIGLKISFDAQQSQKYLESCIKFLIYANKESTIQWVVIKFPTQIKSFQYFT